MVTPLLGASGADLDALRHQLDEPADRLRVVIGEHPIDLTDLNKPLWRDERLSGGTKRDFLRYLIRVAPFLLEHLRDRPVEITRCPDGIDGEALFGSEQFDPPPFVRTVRLWSADQDEPIRHLLVADLATLLWLGERCAVELLPWLSRVDRGPVADAATNGRAAADRSDGTASLWFPDFLVVNLDWRRTVREDAIGESATDELAFRRVADVALDLRSVASALGMRAFVKTSGRRGLHCYLPLDRRLNYSEVRVMAEMIGQFLMAVRPRSSTRTMTMLAQTGFISVDHNQNTWGKVLVAPYSVRRHPAATVSTPLLWSELPSAYPTRFTMDTVPHLLMERGDPWADIVPARPAAEVTAPPEDKRPSGGHRRRPSRPAMEAPIAPR